MKYVSLVTVTIVLLGSVFAYGSAQAESPPQKVDPSTIQKLTPENAPRPSLSERLSAAIKGDDADVPAVDPSKSAPPALKAPKPELPPTAAPDAKPLTQKPVLVDSEPAELPKVPAPKNIDAKIKDAPPAASGKNKGAPKPDGVVTPQSTPQNPQKTTRPAPAAKPAADAAPAPAAAPAATAEKPEEKPEEKQGLRQYLPW